MIAEMEKANLPMPVFENQREDFVVTFYNGEYPELYPEKLLEDKKTQDKKTQDKKSQDKKSQDKKSQDKRNQICKKILEICKEPKSINEIMQEMGYKSNRTLKRMYISMLLKENKLAMTIPDKPTSRNQKYITVE